ncbi:Cytoskeleton protein RodZ [bacterium HR11]|nr:Cytoskeleton protein RodZ [bacterium HR11]
MAIGPLLRQARQVRNLSQREVAERLRIPVAYVQAMEEERWEALPGGHYRRAFVRAYADWLGVPLTPEALAALSAPSTEGPYSRSDRRPRGKSLLRFWWAGIAALVAVVSGIWWHVQRPTGNTGPAGDARTTPVVEPASVAPRSPSGDAGVGASPTPIRLRVVAEENCWLEVYADGRRVFLGTLRAGESYRIEATTQVRLATVGNAGALRVFVNDQPVPPLGGLGETRRDVIFDVSRLPSREPPSPP